MHDVLLIGSGLSATLSAYLLKKKQPHLKIGLLEACREGECTPKTWSFQTLPESSDPTPLKTFSNPSASWIAPLIDKSWIGYEVRFPRFRKTMASTYHSIKSESFFSKMNAELVGDIHYECRVVRKDLNQVTTDDGRVFSAKLILDARGWPKGKTYIGYQKFLGLNLKLKKKHKLKHPILMDAEVQQKDGFRFLYVLPFSETSVLIEDTSYSNSAEIDQNSLKKDILEYAAKLGLEVESIESLEHGSLGLPGFDDSGIPHEEGILGVRGGFFHPTTGYSFYEAIRTAEHLAKWVEKGEMDSIPAKLKKLGTERYNAQEFYRRLNNMLFSAAEGQDRYKVLERFYEHDADLIGRFYAGQTSLKDKAKILSGRPPIPVKKAIYHFFNKFDPRLEVKHA